MICLEKTGGKENRDTVTMASLGVGAVFSQGQSMKAVIVVCNSLESSVGGRWICRTLPRVVNMNIV